jgi:peptide/nickel transport system ATP-binding protein
LNKLLTIDNLSVQFSTLDGPINAIENVSLTVNEGEVVAIVGESGSGKSVTSMSIAQLHPKAITTYTSGTITLYQNEKEINILKASKTQLEQLRGNAIGMIFQEPMTSLNPVMRCGKQIVEVLTQHQKINKKQAEQKVIELFEKVQIPNPKESFAKYPHQLSGGQKQRVMIAMAICCNPSLLICDEPTTALDVTVQKNILQLIKDVQAQFNIGVLFISHDLGLVKSIAHRIVVMYKGKIVEQGTAHQILNNPQHPYTKALLACRPALYPKGVRLPVVSDFLQPLTATQKEERPIIKKAINTPIAETSPIIEVKNLTISYPTKRNIFGKVKEQFTAVDQVSFTINAGQTVGLVGESGCGKTTLGRAILQLITPSSGSILYNNNNIATFSTQQKQDYRKEVQIVFQDPYSSLNPRLAIGDAIMEAIIINSKNESKSNAKQKVMNLLQQVELKTEHFKRYPHEFSGGQRQRIVIARALAVQPQFIVCDESVSALDVSVQAQILNLLNDLKKEFKFTTLFISHDLSVVRYISDTIMVMQKGKIVETGDANNIYNNPQHPYTQNLINSIPK